MERLFLLLAIVSLTACKSGGGAQAVTFIDTPPPASATPDDPQVPPQDPPVQDPVTQPQTVSLTYYTLARTDAPVSGFVNKTYTATGACAVIDSKTFCWDDGVQTVDFTQNNFRYGPLTYTYFGLSDSNNSSGFSKCSGGCVVDFMLDPTLITNAIEVNITDAVIQNVFDNGVSHQATCTQTDNVIDCGDYQFDLGAQ